jgi:hypothetical protein
LFPPAVPEIAGAPMKVTTITTSMMKLKIQMAVVRRPPLSFFFGAVFFGSLDLR